MKTIIKIVIILLVIYATWNLGRWYGQVESRSKRTMTNIFDNRVEKYNEIMLKNCLEKNQE